MHPSDMRLPAQFPAVARLYRRTLRTASIPAANNVYYEMLLPRTQLVLVRSRLTLVAGSSTDVTITLFDNAADAALPGFGLGPIHENADASVALEGPILIVAGSLYATPRTLSLPWNQLFVQFQNNDGVNAGTWGLDLTFTSVG